MVSRRDMLMLAAVSVALVATRGAGDLYLALSKSGSEANAGGNGHPVSEDVPASGDRPSIQGHQPPEGCGIA